MAELISKLGIDWKLLLAQIINFLILMWVLKRYAYKPIIAMLERRRTTIEKSLDDAKKIDDQLASLQKEKDAIISEARAQAHQVIETASKDAAALITRSKDEAKVETAAMVDTTRKDIARMKEAIVADAKAELAELVVAGTEKIIRVKLNPTTEQHLINDALTRTHKE